MSKAFTVVVALLFVSSAVADDLPIRPDPMLTPGAVMTTNATTICQPGYSKTVRHTSGKLKAKIYREYGIEKARSHFEVDHLVSLELGGADVAENLWPQSYDTAQWNAHSKDKLENRLHILVCTGQLSIQQAQHDIASDWIAAYQKYLGTP